jgi:hypothetical protein
MRASEPIAVAFVRAEPTDNPPSGWSLAKLDGVLKWRNDSTGEWRAIPARKRE